VQASFGIDIRIRAQLSRIGGRAFDDCPSLRSIALPSSVETVSEYCFWRCENLSKLSFHSGARLSNFGEYAFSRCSSLRSICLPAAVRQISGLALAGSAIGSVSVHSRNRFLRVSGDFLVDFERRSLVRYLGNESTVHIGSVLSVTFASDCRVSNIGKSAFQRSSLQSIRIPSSVEIISDYCFSECRNLAILEFDSGSRLSDLGDFAFANCSSLRWLCLPASLRRVGWFGHGWFWTRTCHR
jgi:hypothetical protein